MRGKACSLSWMKQWRDFLLDASMSEEEKAEILCFNQEEINNLTRAIKTKENLQAKVKLYYLSNNDSALIEPKVSSFELILAPKKHERGQARDIILRYS